MPTHIKQCLLSGTKIPALTRYSTLFPVKGGVLAALCLTLEIRWQLRPQRQHPLSPEKGGGTCLIKPGLFACTGTWSTHLPVN